MKYDSAYDETYKGLCLTVYSHDNGTHTVDIKDLNGTLINGFNYIQNLNDAIAEGKKFIDTLHLFKPS